MKEDDPRINVFNRQRKLPIETRALRQFLQRLSERLQLKAGFSVVFISDAAMRRYHARFAGCRQITDVLSFPGEPRSGRAEETYLGDVLISVETAERQRCGALETELQILALHGVLHLLGYDHATDSGEMETLERRLRRELLSGAQKDEYFAV